MDPLPALYLGLLLEQGGLIKQLDDAVDGKVSPKEAMENVQKQVSAVIK